MNQTRFMAAAMVGLLVIVLSRPSFACFPPDDRDIGAQLRVVADLDSATVFLDSLRVGVTPLLLESVQPGTHTLRVSPPHPEEWQLRSVADTLTLWPGESRLCSFQLRTYVPVRSEPPGAEVYLNDTLAGVTPLLITPAEFNRASRVTFKKGGFEPVSMLPADLAGSSVLTVALKEGWQAHPVASSPFLLEQPGWSARRTGMYISGGVAVLAGIGAAYFKIAADDRQDAYLATGDPAVASERKRLDTMAGISLAFAQAGIMILSYLLIQE